jgi:DNA gyrase/topoisomerase IV subunit A
VPECRTTPLSRRNIRSCRDTRGLSAACPDGLLGSAAQTPAERLQDLESRLHIFEGLQQVLDDPHRFIDVVLAGTEIDDTVEALQAAFGFSEIQAVAALDMQFRRLTKRTKSLMRSDVEQMRLERTRLSPS